MTSRKQRRTLVAQLICGSLIVVLSAWACGQQTQHGTKKSSVEKTKPTLAETLEWLQNKVNAQDVAQQSVKLTTGDFLIVTSKTRIMNYEGCSISIRRYSQSIYQGQDTKPPDDEGSIADLAKYNPETRVQKRQIITPADWQPATGWEVIAPYGDASSKNGLTFDFNDEELALRASKALHDAIILCGGKKTKEIY